MLYIEKLLSKEAVTAKEWSHETIGTDSIAQSYDLYCICNINFEILLYLLTKAMLIEILQSAILLFNNIIIVSSWLVNNSIFLENTFRSLFAEFSVADNSVYGSLLKNR